MAKSKFNRKTILFYELKKCIFMRMSLVFLLICVAFNCWSIISDSKDKEWVDYVSKSTKEIGYTMGEDFSRNLKKQTESEEQQILINNTSNRENIFKTYNAESLANYYIGRNHFKGIVADIFRKKYQVVQQSVKRLADAEAAMDVYVGENRQINSGAGGSTNYLHQKLFDKVFRTMNTESILLIILIMLYSFGYEFQHKSHLLVYSSGLGRKITGYKLAAAFIAGIFNFFVIYLSTLLFFFSQYNFSGLWNNNVSSQFNYVFDAGFGKPFITWINFKLYQYLLCVILLSFLLVIVFGFVAAVVGNYIRNTYIGFLIMVLFCFVLLTISSICGNHEWHIIYFIFQNSPTSLWQSQNLWLTELGSGTIIPWQECISMVLQLVTMGGLCRYSMQQFKRRDLLI